MKKLKLLLAFCALLLGWSNASAQASYNHTWTEGVEVAAGSDYFLYNIESKTFFSSGMDWGTRASGDHSGRVVTLAGSDGAYTIYSAFYSANGYDIASGYLTNTDDAPFVDNNTTGNYGAYTFTAVSVSGYTNAYTIKNGDKYLYYNTTDTRINWGDTEQHWLIIPKSVRDAAGDYTYYIQNQGMNRPWQRAVWGGVGMWTSDWSNAEGNYWAHGGNGDNPCAEKYHKSGDIYQTISSSLAAGRYRLSVQAFYRQDDNASESAPILYIGDNTNNIGVKTGSENNMTDASTSFSAGNYVNNVEAFLSGATENVKIGLKTTGSHQWVIWDNFVLDYLGQCVMDYAVKLPDGGAMAADTWYYFDIAAAADNYNANATTLGDIICTDDGYALTSAASGNVTLTATNNSFAAKRYYVKSSSANNLEIGVASYTYSISEASADVSYIQAGNTVTVSYTTSTNEPGATLTQDYSGVTFGGNAISVTTTASGFTFTVPTVTANTEYTLSIPAGAIKYNEENKNAAQNITLKTPAVFDGTYFLKAAATYDGTSEGTSAAVGKYLARGMNYGTHATLDKYGLPVQITTNGNNETTIQAYDTKRYFFHANSYDCYADQASLAATSYFTVTLNNGKLLIHNNSMAAGTYLKYNTSAAGDANIAVYDDGNGTNSGPIIMWTTENASAHATAMQSYKDAQAATAAAAAYASGNYASLNGITTVSALEEELEAHYIKGDFVSPSAIESISEKYQGGQPGSGNITETVYSNTIKITEPGFYKFSMQAFYRAASNEVTQAMHTNGVDFPPVVLYFGNSETQIKSIYDEGGLDQGIAEGYFETETVGGAPVQYNGKWYTNGQHNSVIIFQKDYYHNDVYFYASEPGTYEYGVKYMGWACANAQWFIYSPESVEITSYAAAADAADYTALQNAINAYDAATWGFETGEYAPYNNVEAINNIAAAKAIDKEAENSKLLVNSLTTKLALTANAVEVNAFYKGDFDGYTEDTSSPLDYTPNGWTATDNFRVMIKNVEDYPGLADASAGTAAMSWSGGITYGETAGYTMPLKANTVYRLQFKAAGWNNETRSGMSVSILNSSDGMALYNLGTPDRDIKGNATNTAGMTSYDVVFATGAAGNYVFQIKSGNNMVVTDFSITKAASQVLEFADNSAVPTYAPGTYPTVKITRELTAGRWATAVYPFAINKSAVGEIAVLARYNSEAEIIGFDNADNSTANVPFLMRSTTDKSDITLSNVAVAAASATNAVAGDDASLVGSYVNNTVVEKDAGNYILSNNTIYPVGDDVKVNAYRAYINIAGNNSARALRFVVGEITGVDNVEAATEATLKDGKYLENGKIVIVKNGQKFNANGQQVK